MTDLPRLIESDAALRELTRTLADAPLLAVDTESNAFYAYRQRVCLIQLSDGQQDWVVDPRAVNDLAPLAELLALPSVTKVLHAAEGDILALRRDLGFGIQPLFDTMIAARYLGVRRFGLADLLAELFGVNLDKRFQRHDWGARPIPPEALVYAAADVRHLLPLRESLRTRLIEVNRLAEAEEEFARVARVTPEERPFDRDGFWRMRGARDLNPRGLAVLRELYLFRDERARAQDRPPVKVLSDDVLIGISHQLPTDPHGLRRAGASAHQIERFGNDLLAAIRRGHTQPPPRPPQGNGPPDPRITARFDQLRAWRRQRAEAMGVEPEVLMSNAMLRALAERAPAAPADVAAVAGLGPHKSAAYAEDLARVLREVG